jgi:murein DD-endopeptidase MepM/ murein hydrolase activator NlpD
MELIMTLKIRHIIAFLIILLAIIATAYFLYRYLSPKGNRTQTVLAFIRNPDPKSALIQSALSRCGDAPFIMPSTGMIGFIWDDSFRPGHRHQGIDIFSGQDVGKTPIYSAYDGYLTRLSDWKSSVIIRIPSDPLEPGRQIWIYYTHMADALGNSLIIDRFPRGTSEEFIPAGTMLGFMGNYSGNSGAPTGIHLHFSIVMDDGEGMFLNELEIQNTLDPSPYFGLALNANHNKNEIPVCQAPYGDE